MRWLGLALLVVVGGCSNKDNLCGTVSKDSVCYTVHLSGNIDGNGIDQLQVDTTYNESTGSGNDFTVRTLIGVIPGQIDGGVASLPISFPVVLELPGLVDGLNSRVTVVAQLAGHNVGVGTTKLGVGFINDEAPNPGSSNSVSINLTPASSSQCFDPSFVGSAGNEMKTDVDCGGPNCPACRQSEKCNQSSDCVFPLVCGTPTSSTSFVQMCLPASTM